MSIIYFHLLKRINYFNKKDLIYKYKKVKNDFKT